MTSHSLVTLLRSCCITLIDVTAFLLRLSTSSRNYFVSRHALDIPDRTHTKCLNKPKLFFGPNRIYDERAVGVLSYVISLNTLLERDLCVNISFP